MKPKDCGINCSNISFRRADSDSSRVGHHEAQMNHVTITPVLSERYCPHCEPHRDPLVGIAVIDWCGSHRPRDGGTADGFVVRSDHPLLGCGEANGDENRAWCALFHCGS